MKQAMRKLTAFGLAGLISFSAWASKSNDVRAKIAEKLGDKNELVLKLKKRDKRTDIKLAQVLKYLPNQMRVGGHVVEFEVPENNGEDKNGNNHEGNNNPKGGNDDNNDAPQYDNFPDSASFAINEQENNPENDPKEDPEGGGDGNGGKDGNSGNTGSGKISNNPNSSTQTEEVKENPDSTEKTAMLAFMKNYPANGSDNYNNFINRFNEQLTKTNTETFKTLETNILSQINSINFYLTVTKDERAKLKAIAKKLNKTYGWHLKMLDEQSHKELLANPTYKRNYEILKKKFTPDVRSACAMVDKLDDMGKKSLLLTTYHQFIDAPTSIVSIRDRKSFLVVYYNDVKYNNMPAGKINSHFKSTMNEAKKLMFSNLGVIVIPSEIRTKAVELQKKREAEAEKQSQKSMEGVETEFTGT